MKITSFESIPKFAQNGTYQIDISPKDLIKSIDQYVREDGLQLNPDFQRGHVWNQAQQISYLEFFLKGGKTGNIIYLNKPSWHSCAKTSYDEFVIVDGKQRLQAWTIFLNNEIKVFDSYFNEYTDSPRRSTMKIKININDLATKAEVLQWYIDFNSGGTVHSQAEIDRVKDLLLVERFRLEQVTSDVTCSDYYRSSMQIGKADIPSGC